MVSANNLHRTNSGYMEKVNRILIRVLQRKIWMALGSKFLAGFLKKAKWLFLSISSILFLIYSTCLKKFTYFFQINFTHQVFSSIPEQTQPC